MAASEAEKPVLLAREEPDSSNEKRKSSSSDKNEDEDSDEREAAVKKPRFSFKMTSRSIATESSEAEALTDDRKGKAMAPISLKLGAQKPKESPTVMKAASASVAKAFNMDEDDDEEMPPEAKMRMRNIGRDTPTSAGPNSFGKTRQGFCDTKKMYERQIKKKMLGDDTTK